MRTNSAWWIALAGACLLLASLPVVAEFSTTALELEENHPAKQKQPASEARSEAEPR